MARGALGFAHNLAVADRRDIDVIPKLVCIIDATVATAEDTWYSGYSHWARLLRRTAAAVTLYERCRVCLLWKPT